MEFPVILIKKNEAPRHIGTFKVRADGSPEIITDPDPHNELKIDDMLDRGVLEIKYSYEPTLSMLVIEK